MVSLKMTSTFLKIVSLLCLILSFSSWPVHMKSILSSDRIDTVSNATTIESRSNYEENIRQLTPISSWFGGLFGSTPTSPFIRCSCSCGDANTDAKGDARIVGGKNAESNEYPWMARLLYFDRFYCGGSLINDRYVLSAAHCSKTLAFMIKVTFGEHNRCNSKPALTRYVSRIITRRTFFAVIDNDIALLRLDDRVPINRIIRPICLPKNAAEYTGTDAIVAGWGATSENGRSSCLLRQVNVPILSNFECRNNTNYRNLTILMTDNMMCAGHEKGGADSCQGDSGGPLIVQREDKRYEIAGIVSWGVGCARAGYPGVYTRVVRYLNWILENSRDGCFCRD